MQTEVFKTIQITGSSTSGIDEAKRAAVEKAAQTVHHLRWFKVVETRGHIDERYWNLCRVRLPNGYASFPHGMRKPNPTSSF